MKKLVSLLLALLLGLCTLSASAETVAPVPTFDLNIQAYQTMFNMFVTSAGLTPEWTASEDGLTYTCKIADFPDVIVVTASDRCIASISLSTELTLANAATMGNNLGEMMSYASMSALFLLDESFSNDVDTFTNTLINLLSDGLDKLGTEPGSASVTAHGAVFTFLTGAFGETSLSADLTFRMTPAVPEDEAAAQAAQASESADLTASTGAPAADGEVFPYALEDYKLYFDMFAASLLGTTPVWATAEDGRSITVDAGDFGTMLVSLNEEGAVLNYACSITANVSNAYDMGNSFGQLVALIALSSKAAEDISFISSQDNINQFTTEVLSLLSVLTENMTDAMSGPVSVTDEVAGDTCTFTMYFDAQTLNLTFGFVYEP